MEKNPKESQVKKSFTNSFIIEENKKVIYKSEKYFVP